MKGNWSILLTTSLWAAAFAVKKQTRKINRTSLPSPPEPTSCVLSAWFSESEERLFCTMIPRSSSHLFHLEPLSFNTPELLNTSPSPLTSTPVLQEPWRGRGHDRQQEAGQQVRHHPGSSALQERERGGQRPGLHWSRCAHWGSVGAVHHHVPQLAPEGKVRVVMMIKVVVMAVGVGEGSLPDIPSPL